MKEGKNVLLLEAVATMIGTIIGAGILGIPYVFAQAGFWTGALVLLVAGAAMFFLKLLYGEVTLRTKGVHQVVGYTGIYLGKFWKRVMSVILILSINGSLLAYLIGQGEVIEAITGIPQLWASLGFFFLFSVFVYIGIAIVKRLEFIMAGVIFLAIIVIGFLSWGYVDLSNLRGFDASKLLIPYGILLFATSGIVSVPEVRQILINQERLVKRAIIFGCTIPPIIYFLFAALVISVSGENVTQVASVGLGNLLGWKMILIANVFAFFTMATSFLTLGVALRQIYQYDYRMPRLPAWLLVLAVPLVVFFLGERNFQEVLSIVGAIGIGVAGAIEVVTYWVARKKGKRKPEYTVPGWLGVPGGVLLIVLFMVGAVYTLLTM